MTAETVCEKFQKTTERSLHDMNWLSRYRIRHYVANSIWILPLISMLIAMGLARITNWIDQSRGWESELNPEAARTVLTTLASSMFTFIVFVSSALLVAV